MASENAPLSNVPHSLEAERSVLGAVLIDNDLLNRVVPVVTSDDFFRESHAWTYEACLALWERSEVVNQVTVAHELDRRGHLEAAVTGLAAHASIRQKSFASCWRFAPRRPVTRGAARLTVVIVCMSS